MRPRFFIGLREIGHITLYLSRGLRELGYPVTNVVRKINSPFHEREHEHDRYIELPKNKFSRFLRFQAEFLRQIPFHDVFVFNRSETFCSYLQRSASDWVKNFAYADLHLLNRLGRKIVVIVTGSEIRSKEKLLEDMRTAGLHEHLKYVESELQSDTATMLEMKRRLVTNIERYADHIFARPIHVQSMSRKHHMLWLPIDLDTVQFNISDEDQPVIVHAPTNPQIKGTKYVLRAIQKLREEGYQFKFELYQHLPNVEVRKRLAHSHIAIDQLILPGYALFAIEAMATGNAVLGSAVAGYNGFSKDMPIMTTTPETIYDNLKRLLEDRQLLTELARYGRKYVERFHDYKTVANKFISAISQRD